MPVGPTNSSDATGRRRSPRPHRARARAAATASAARRCPTTRRAGAGPGARAARGRPRSCAPRARQRFRRRRQAAPAGRRCGSLCRAPGARRPLSAGAGAAFRLGGRARLRHEDAHSTVAGAARPSQLQRHAGIVRPIMAAERRLRALLGAVLIVPYQITKESLFIDVFDAVGKGGGRGGRGPAGLGGALFRHFRLASAAAATDSRRGRRN